MNTTTVPLPYTKISLNISNAHREWLMRRRALTGVSVTRMLHDALTEYIKRNTPKGGK